MSLILRPSTPADFDILHQIDEACYPPGIAYSKHTLRWFLDRPEADCLVAVQAGQVAGFILAEHEGARAHVITIDVLESYRRRSVGTALLNRMEQRLAARGVRGVELETATDNPAAVAFWHKHGYRTVCVLRGYYLNRADAFSMHKELPAKT